MNQVILHLIEAGIIALFVLFYKLSETLILSTMAMWPNSNYPTIILRIIFLIIALLSALCVHLSWKLHNKKSNYKMRSLI